MVEQVNGFIQAERAVLLAVGSKVWPFELTPETHQNLQRLEELSKKGIRFIGAFPHFSERDVQMVAAIMFTNPYLRSLQMLVPLAWHQQSGIKGKGLFAMTGTAHLETPMIVTDDTMKKEREIARENRNSRDGKKIKTPWPIMRGSERKFLYDEYLRRSGEVLYDGGIVAISPTAGRRPTLENFVGYHPMRAVEEAAFGQGVRDLGAFTVTIEVPGIEDYSEIRGLNFGMHYKIGLRRPTPRDEIAGDIDQWVYEDMIAGSPKAYLPK